MSDQLTATIGDDQLTATIVETGPKGDEGEINPANYDAKASLHDNDKITGFDSENSDNPVTWLGSVIKSTFATLFVDKSSDEAVGGVKSFSDFPLTPASAPSTDYQVANKKYTDDRDAEKANLTGGNTFTGDQQFDDSVGVGGAHIANLTVNGVGGPDTGLSVRNSATAVDWRLYTPASGAILYIGGRGQNNWFWKADFIGSITNTFQSARLRPEHNIVQILGQSGQTGNYLQATSSGGSSGDIFVVKANGDVGIEQPIPDTKLDVNGALTIRKLSADPADPDEGGTVIWRSDGTASGNDGDVLLKSTAGGITKLKTLDDFSL